MCTCVRGSSSHGCARCCTYGSLEQRTAKAQHLIALLDEGQELRESNRTLAHQLERRADGFDPLAVMLRAERDVALAELATAKAERERLRQQLTAWQLQSIAYQPPL